MIDKESVSIGARGRIGPVIEEEGLLQVGAIAISRVVSLRKEGTGTVNGT